MEIEDKVAECLKEKFKEKAVITLISENPVCRLSVLFTESHKPYSREDIPCAYAGVLQSMEKEGDRKSVIYYRHCNAEIQNNSG